MNSAHGIGSVEGGPIRSMLPFSFHRSAWSRILTVFQSAILLEVGLPEASCAMRWTLMLNHESRDEKVRQKLYERKPKAKKEAKANAQMGPALFRERENA